MSLLVLRLSALGDVIHTVPAVVALGRAFPETTIRWVVEAPYRELVEIVAGVEAIPVSIRKWGRSLMASRGEIRRALRSMRGHELSVDFQGLIKSASLPWLAGVKRRYGFERGAIREKPAAWFINRPIAVDRSRNVVDWNLDLASGVAGRTLPMPDVDFASFAADPEGKVRGLEQRIVLLPGAGRPEKLWPVERFRELARSLGEGVVVAWGPGEREIAERIGAPLAPTTNLRELAELLRTARIVVGADTGPLHLAAALGTRVVGLYGPTSARRNGPYGQVDRCIDVEGPMTAVATSDVLRRVGELLG